MSRFYVEAFLSHSAEKFRRWALLCCVWENSRGRKSLWIREGGGEYQDLPSKIFCLTVPKNSVGEPFCAIFQKISGSEKVLDKRGGGRSIKIFRRECFVSQFRKFP